MANNISLTIRLPHELNTKLKAISKDVGMTKTNLIRIVIHELAKGQVELDFSPDSSSNRDRLVLNVNQLTYDILDNACKQYNQSMNAVVTAICAAALEYSAKWLQATEM